MGWIAESETRYRHLIAGLSLGYVALRAPAFTVSHPLEPTRHTGDDDTPRADEIAVARPFMTPEPEQVVC